MLFNSIAFAFFLPTVFGLYWFILNKKLKIQNLFLFVASYVFYACWDWRFLFLIFASSLVDFYCGQKIALQTSKKEKKKYLYLSLFVNLGVLGFFKYFNFFIDSFDALFSFLNIDWTTSTLNILLPVGISFYTFQTLSYTIDIYRDKLKPTSDIIQFFAFVSFFPQLVAGPIERAIDLLPQFNKTRTFNYAQAVSGSRKILMGLFKKVVVADQIAKYVAFVYDTPDAFGGLSIIIAMVLFTIQVYCDFSGYSDIAIGVAQLFGFELTINFKTPLFSKSMKEFWSRWHISLSTWFRDYLYIPLGGNRRSKSRWYFNLFFTFLISGLWHGASWAFVVWGALHGAYLIVEIIVKDFFIKFNRITGLSRFPKVLGFIKGVITFHLFAFALLIFRAEKWSDATTLIANLPKRIIMQFSSWDNFVFVFKEIFKNQRDFVFLLLSIFILFIVDFTIKQKSFDLFFDRFRKPVRYLIYAFFIAWFLIFGAYNEPQQFVYFQF
jgi:D-alanyl-lipoteichoic acid acyltransferase DltB (MBOAT superfamily)